jgi:hypothetical protein
MSFLSPSARHRGEPPGDGHALPASLRPQVFSTSRRFAPPTTLPGLFRPGHTHGVSPFRGFPPPAPDASRLAMPLVTLEPARRPPLPKEPRAPSRPPAYRGLSDWRIRSPPNSNEEVCGADPLVGFVLSRAIPPAMAHAVHVGLPSCASRRDWTYPASRTHPVRAMALQGLNPPADR